MIEALLVLIVVAAAASAAAYAGVLGEKPKAFVDSIVAKFKKKEV